MNQNLHHADMPVNAAEAIADTDLQSYGDVRKAAYLKRRAAYQQQAQAPGTMQAGTLARGQRPA